MATTRTTSTMKKNISCSFTFSLYISLSVFFCLVSAFYPTDQYLVNCGSCAAVTLDPDHRSFTGDGESRFLKSTRTIQIQNVADSSSPLYHTARAFNHLLHYAFPIKDRGTHHLVRLHFQPFYYSKNNLHEAEFHVLANGFLLLRNFRIPKTDKLLPIIKEFVIPVNSDKLEITFMPSEKSKLGFVNAIEVISAPKDLIADVATFVGFEKNEWVNGLLKNGFETVHRVNVGGLKVTPFNDSLWRTWVTDDEHLKSEKIEKVHFGGRIHYQIGGASREVGPDNVYNTARVIRSLDNSIPDVNITWTFEVEKGYRYMVRMHFCDIASAAMGMLYFDVYVNGNLAYKNLDLSDITNRLLASPFYADFVVDDEENSGAIIVSVGPSDRSLPRAVDAILNGVEIWKMNNTMGSFDGKVCAEFLRRNWRRGHVAVLLPLLAAVFLLLTASVFMLRKRTGSMGWSRLPMDVSDANLKYGNELSSIKA